MENNNKSIKAAAVVGPSSGRSAYRWLIGSSGALAIAALSWAVVAASSDFKLVSLASEPLYAAGAGQKPTLSLALSVEFPTVGAQYTNANYATANEYIGYFDAESCYSYVNDADASRRRFDRIGPATNRACGGTGFSGNFMNWAASSAIDMLRLGLTGGDRIVDEPGLTVLQRAVLRRNSFYNDSNFPSKLLPAALASGAVPSSLLGTWTSNVYVSNCLNRMHFGTQATGNCNEPGNNSVLGVATPAAGGSVLHHGTSKLSDDRFFYARVKVCESTGGVLQDPRSRLCQRYNSGNFKPVGNLQRFSDRVRVAAFGYLMEDAQSRYGGVLRAPMKFVGPRGFDANGAPIGDNPAKEWDANTGVFTLNPESAAEGISGVVNYLNRFGRTGAVEGTYKTYDPVGELYYESLRYVQGLQPTPQATQGMTDAMKEGFPVYTSWVDPHASGSRERNYSCLANNIVVIGDKNTHNDKSIPGNTARLADHEFARPANVAGNEPDFVAWTRVVGGFESNTAVPYSDGMGVGRTTSNPNPSGLTAPIPGLAGIAGADTGSTRAAYYIAGMAYWANTHDIRGEQWTAEPAKQRPGMRVKTYILDVNEFGGQNDWTARHTSQYFLAGKYGAFRDKSGMGNPFLAADGTTLDNGGWERGITGEASGYHLSSSAKEVLAALDAIFEQVVSSGNSIAGASVSSQEIGADGGLLYQGSFNPDRWSGDVVASALVRDTTSGAIGVQSGAAPGWAAAALLDLKDHATRKLFVGKTDPVTSAATELQWSAIENSTNPATPEARLKGQLDVAYPGAPADGLGERRLAYLRGVRTDEGTLFRVRNSRLGDIVNSGVVYSGAPSQRFSTASYRTFYEANKSRAAAVFVGANDGMLHAFNATTGDELFGYIPSWMGPRLSMLAAPSYGTAPVHQSYVDATPRVGEAEIVSGSTTTWKTVLVGGTGAGGQGVYALDVSDPSAFDASKVMWEFTDRNDADMGNVVGRPQILRFRTSAPGVSPAAYRSFAVVASGVNNTAPDGFASTGGNPTIFLLDLSKAAGDAWTLNTNYYKLTLPVDATLAVTMAPGVLEFRATAGLNGEVTNLYAGDLHGNLWKFDFSLHGTGNWKAEKLSPFSSGSVPYPMFIAKDGSAAQARQPITTAPTLVSGPNQTLIVSFGTGKYLESSDNIVTATTQKQTLYSLYDPMVYTGLSASNAQGAIRGRGRLAVGSVAASGAVTVPSFAWGWASSDSDSTKRTGWYVDLPVTGERQVSSAVNWNGTLVYGSVIPPSTATDPCGAGGGKAYVLNVATGSGQSITSTVGLLGEPLILQSGAALESGLDGSGQGTSTTSGQIVLQGVKGANPIEPGLSSTRRAGTLSWRRINNYLKLKDGATE